MAVTGLQGLIDSLADLAGGRLPGTESQLPVEVLVFEKEFSGGRQDVRNFVASIKNDLLTE